MFTIYQCISNVKKINTLLDTVKRPQVSIGPTDTESPDVFTSL